MIEENLSMTANIRVLCIDDHAFLIEGLTARFADEPGFEVCGSLDNAGGLADAISRHQPDIVLLDIEMPGRDVFDVLEELPASELSCRIILLSGHVRQTYLDLAIKAGAWGYLSKRDEPGEIIAAVRQVHEGRFAFSPEVSSKCGLDPIQTDAADRTRIASSLGRLTPRELQILRMIGRGMPRHEIASTIHRSPKTVDAHRSSIMDKLNLHDRVELARFAIREGLVEL